MENRLGKRHLDHLLVEFTAYINEHRAHSERDNFSPIREMPDEVETLSPGKI